MPRPRPNKRVLTLFRLRLVIDHRRQRCSRPRDDIIDYYNPHFGSETSPTAASCPAVATRQGVVINTGL